MKKSIKKLIIAIAIIICIIIVASFIRFILGGAEDTWICSAGNWVQHGNPISAMPNSTC